MYLCGVVQYAKFLTLLNEETNTITSLKHWMKLYSKYKSVMVNGHVQKFIQYIL